MMALRFTAPHSQLVRGAAPALSSIAPQSNPRVSPFLPPPPPRRMTADVGRRLQLQGADDVGAPGADALTAGRGDGGLDITEPHTARAPGGRALVGPTITSADDRSPVVLLPRFAPPAPPAHTMRTVGGYGAGDFGGDSAEEGVPSSWYPTPRDRAAESQARVGAVNLQASPSPPQLLPSHVPTPGVLPRLAALRPFVGGSMLHSVDVTSAAATPDHSVPLPPAVAVPPPAISPSAVRGSALARSAVAARRDLSPGNAVQLVPAAQHGDPGAEEEEEEEWVIARHHLPAPSPLWPASLTSTTVACALGVWDAWYAVAVTSTTIAATCMCCASAAATLVGWWATLRYPSHPQPTRRRRRSHLGCVTSPAERTVAVLTASMAVSLGAVAYVTAASQAWLSAPVLACLLAAGAGQLAVLVSLTVYRTWWVAGRLSKAHHVAEWSDPLLPVRPRDSPPHIHVAAAERHLRHVATAAIGNSAPGGVLALQPTGGIPTVDAASGPSWSHQ